MHSVRYLLYQPPGPPVEPYGLVGLQFGPENMFHIKTVISHVYVYCRQWNLCILICKPIVSPRLEPYGPVGVHLCTKDMFVLYYSCSTYAVGVQCTTCIVFILNHVGLPPLEPYGPVGLQRPT